ncbi:hypothetical protein T02_6228 [Trichinella nativa]|uniref:Uncharacterized protein n=1 Tax=Trichinella nativa TaxID=6335 RepID=A0A0V1LB34_9BILA|nr:hypothetical protein T02_6228 [Trichinella nativa]
MDKDSSKKFLTDVEMNFNVVTGGRRGEAIIYFVDICQSRGRMRRIVVGCGMSGVCLVIGESIDDDDDDSQLIRLNQQKQ